MNSVSLILVDRGDKIIWFTCTLPLKKNKQKKSKKASCPSVVSEKFPVV